MGLSSPLWAEFPIMSLDFTLWAEVPHYGFSYPKDWVTLPNKEDKDSHERGIAVIMTKSGYTFRSFLGEL